MINRIASGILSTGYKRILVYLSWILTLFWSKWQIEVTASIIIQHQDSEKGRFYRWNTLLFFSWGKWLAKVCQCLQNVLVGIILLQSMRDQLLRRSCGCYIVRAKITANRRTFLGLEDNFSGPQSSKWHCDGLTRDLKVKVRGGFRIRHLAVMVRIRIRGLGNTLYLCVLTK